ncbi:MAG: DNA-binding protein WhiA [Oscillospiraceae bacterium]|jgi:DNA-binding protein WhiA|nr:DNA-binding protein WhiA [Oscillospiraceae bacterium]
MSFSSRLKAELCAAPQGKMCCVTAELYGVFLMGQTWNAELLRVVTTHPDLPARLRALMLRRLGFEFDEAGGHGGRSLVIHDAKKLDAVFGAFGLERIAGQSIHLNHAALEDNCCRSAFCRGVFLSGGSMTDPEKKYHLEILTPHRHLTRELIPVLHEYGFEPKQTSRGGVYGLIFQSSESIEDFLTFMGAPLASLELMQIKQMKEVRNNVNRQVNCETRNFVRTLDAAARQIDGFGRLRRSREWDGLPEPLKAAALARLEAPDASLSELAETLGIGRSALNHRFRKLEALNGVCSPSRPH